MNKARWEQVCDELAMLAVKPRQAMHRATTQPARDLLRERIERESARAQALYNEAMKGSK